MAERKRIPVESRLTRLSKTMTWLLRHGAEQHQLAMRKDGYVCVQDLLHHPKLRGVTFLTLEEIVKQDQKQRFHLLHEPSSTETGTSSHLGSWWIRANQGHSLRNVEVDLKRILQADEIPMAVHGTTLQAWSLIEQQGLSRMKRNHIHLAQGKPGANVISGMRNSSQVLIYINVAKAMQAGIKFYLSANGVVLTEGNDYGILEPCYFEKVEMINIKADHIVVPVPQVEEAGAQGTL
ncbi:hypothetical protein APHAL10511_002360 [Amanita phalloides]|nr:hypothetical protein APHAL10511_002360 [Amanita phalloides]